MSYKIVNKISNNYVPQYGNKHKYIAIHYLGVDGQNYELSPNGTGAHYTIYWDGTIYQRCSHDAIVWAVGTGGIYEQKHPYARNNNTISIEMCCHCDGNKGSANDPKWYFTKETQEACVWLVQKLMKDLKIPIENVLRHFDIVNKVCPAPYVHNNKYKTSWTWDEFLQKVKGNDITTQKPLYRVRLSWDNPSSQTNAYEILQNAINDANSHPGYSVYDQTGKAVYTSPDAISSAADTTVAKGVPANKGDYIAKVATICVDLYKTTKILPSVVIAQCCLENGYGLGSDAIELTKRNNLLGMKSELLNSTWSSFSTWSGESYRKPTPEYQNGKMVTVYDNFRVYKDYRECITDYEQFLLNVKSGGNYKYRKVAGEIDPRTVITAISQGGYATDPAYIEKVMKLINENDLTKYDKQAGVKKEAAPVAPTTTEKKWYRAAQAYKDGKYIGQVGAYEKQEGAITKAKEKGICAFDPNGKQIYPEVKQTNTNTKKVVDRYVVRRRWSEAQYQLGAYHDLNNAKNKANENWGFRVYDLENPTKAIYKPKLTQVQKLCAACVRLNQWLLDDIKNKKDWRYYNSKYISESTFWKTRKANKLYTNCMGGVGFAMKEAGLPASACSWYGQKGGGIRWLNSHAEADLRKYADLIKIGNRTPKQLVADGTLCPGDILTFVDLNHTCIYLGNNISYDSGHAFCTEKGEGAHYIKWIGPLSWANSKVGYIIRLKN